MLGIATETVVQVIACARDHEARREGWTDVLESGFREENDPSDFPHGFGGESEPCQLAELLASLNDEERASLLALSWVGRGIIPPAEIADAIDAARAEAAGKPGNMLMSIPMLGDYLEDGLEKLGLATGDASPKLD
jgi:hypothetical protein